MWISCRIKSHSHTLDNEAFRLLQSDATNMRVHKVSEQEFTLSVRPRHPESPEFEQLAEAHQVILCFLIALNVGSLGAFAWAEEPWVHPVFAVTEDMEGTRGYRAAIVAQSSMQHGELTELKEADVYSVVLVFGIVARERTSVLTGEYARGLLLLRMNFAELNFRREAFMCFYRAFEHFIASRILKVSKLGNELKDLQRGLRTITQSQEIIDEFRSIYAIRSSQAAHSQVKQREITLEEVLKVKVFLDMVMNTEFKREANAEMLARRSREQAGGEV